MRSTPACAAEVRKLPPIVFFTGAPLESGAVPNYVWQSNPLGGRWGCSIRLWDPAHPERPGQGVVRGPEVDHLRSATVL